MLQRRALPHSDWSPMHHLAWIASPATILIHTTLGTASNSPGLAIELCISQQCLH